MKAITIFILSFTVLALNVNGQSTDVKVLLDNQETRTEIFNAISSDHQLMKDFMAVARENEHGAMVMRNEENSRMKKKESKKGGMMDINNEDQMMEMMKEKPEVRQKMMGEMLEMCEKDSVMRNNMAKMITEHPKMMEMCMQKMKEKGMMRPEEKMMKKEENLNYKNRKQ